jgi:tetrapyrrole methylase family protein / MazG family protein
MRRVKAVSKIVIVGLGAGSAQHLSLGAVQALQNANVVLLRTVQHPTVAELPNLGISFQSLDWIYDTSERMEDVYPRLAAEVLRIARATKGMTAYAVPGHPLVAEDSVQLLLEQAQAAGIPTEVVASSSAVELCVLRLGIDPLAHGFRLADAQANRKAFTGVPTLYLQIDSRAVASELKLVLLEAFPLEHEVTLLRAVGVPELEEIIRLPLGELDREERFDHLASLFVPPLPEEMRPVTLQELVDIMALLRSPDGCPWDREQDHKSLQECLEEETQEVLEAIDAEDPDSLCEELGDLLLQAVFHAQLASEVGDFNIRDVLKRLRDKLIERHPHVFGDIKLETSDEVLVAWEEIKSRSKQVKQDGKEPVPVQPARRTAAKKHKATPNKKSSTGAAAPKSVAKGKTRNPRKRTDTT